MSGKKAQVAILLHKKTTWSYIQMMQ